MKIAIVGLGYVGLPLSLQFARSGVSVLGLDVDQAKVDAINSGRSYIKHITGEAVSEQSQAGRLEASTDFSRVKEVEAVIICVPTPLNKNREPDISYVLRTAESIAPYLRSVDSGQSTVDSERAGDGATVGEDLQSPSSVHRPPSTEPRAKLVVLESTTYPGTTDEDLRKVLEAGSGLTAGVDFHLAFSPEREDPGNPQSVVKSIPKVIGGYTPACLERAIELYGKAIDRLVPVSSCRAAEATKLLENIFRSVNIALVNELKLIYGAMDIDVWEVINAAKTKPFGYMAFYPGPGLGGHCIPIDPFYLTWKAREFDHHTKFIELAGEINTAMPEYVINRTAEALNARKKAVNGSRVLLIGLAYKPNVDDDRESPTYHLMDILDKRGAEVAYYDPYVPVIKPTREHPHWAGQKSVVWDKETIGSFDAVVIATNHAEINYQELADWAACIVDTRNAMVGIETKKGQVWKA
ncbi:MAG: nucleotide sugar dehydrogenase [Opitutaceae bacterium]